MIKQAYSMNYPKEIEQNTVDNWLTKGTVWPTWYGEENTYYVDQFDNEFFCKNYPWQYGDADDGPNPNMLFDGYSI